MVLHIQAQHFNPQNELIAFITQKVNKLCRFNKRIQKGEIHLILDNSAGQPNKICEIKIAGSGNDMYASSRANTFEEATTKNIDALQHQITKIERRQISELQV